MACLVLFIPWPLLVESVCLEHTDAQGGHGHSVLGHGLWKALGFQSDRRFFWSEVWLAARQKGSVEAGFAYSVLGSDFLLSTVLCTQSGVQRVWLWLLLPREDEEEQGPSQKGEKRLSQGCVSETAVASEVGRSGAVPGFIRLQASPIQGPYAKNRVDTAAQHAPGLEWPSLGRKLLNSHVISSKPQCLASVGAQ